MQPAAPVVLARPVTVGRRDVIWPYQVFKLLELMKIPNPPVNRAICRPTAVRPLCRVDSAVAIQAPFPKPPPVPVQKYPQAEVMGFTDVYEPPRRKQPVDLAAKEAAQEHKLISSHGLLLTRLELEQLEHHLPPQVPFSKRSATSSSATRKTSTLIKCIIRNFGGSCVAHHHLQRLANASGFVSSNRLEYFLQVSNLKKAGRNAHGHTAGRAFPVLLTPYPGYYCVHPYYVTYLAYTAAAAAGKAGRAVRNTDEAGHIPADQIDPLNADDDAEPKGEPLQPQMQFVVACGPPRPPPRLPVNSPTSPVGLCEGGKVVGHEEHDTQSTLMPAPVSSEPTLSLLLNGGPVKPSVKPTADDEYNISGPTLVSATQCPMTDRPLCLFADGAIIEPVSTAAVRTSKRQTTQDASLNSKHQEAERIKTAEAVKQASTLNPPYSIQAVLDERVDEEGERCVLLQWAHVDGVASWERFSSLQSEEHDRIELLKVEQQCRQAEKAERERQEADRLAAEAAQLATKRRLEELREKEREYQRKRKEEERRVLDAQRREEKKKAAEAARKEEEQKAQKALEAQRFLLARTQEKERKAKERKEAALKFALQQEQKAAVERKAAEVKQAKEKGKAAEVKQAKEKVQAAIREALLKSAKSSAAAAAAAAVAAAAAAAGSKRKQSDTACEEGSREMKKKPAAGGDAAECNGRKKLAQSAVSVLPSGTSAKRAHPSANVTDPVQTGRPAAAKKAKLKEADKVKEAEAGGGGGAGGSGGAHPEDKELSPKMKAWRPKVGDRVASFWPSEGAWFKGSLQDKTVQSTQAGGAECGASSLSKPKAAGLPAGQKIEDRLPSGMRTALLQQSRRSKRGSGSSKEAKGASVSAGEGLGGSSDNTEWHLQYDDGDWELIVWPDETLQRLDKKDGLTLGDDEPTCFKNLQTAAPPAPPTRMLTTCSHGGSEQSGKAKPRGGGGREGSHGGAKPRTQQHNLADQPNGKGNNHGGSLSGQAVVGKRVVVWWPLERDWFQGIITRFDKAKDSYTIKYDDDDLDVVHLPNDYVRFIA